MPGRVRRDGLRSAQRSRAAAGAFATVALVGVAASAPANPVSLRVGSQTATSPISTPSLPWGATWTGPGAITSDSGAAPGLGAPSLGASDGQPAGVPLDAELEAAALLPAAEVVTDVDLNAGTEAGRPFVSHPGLGDGVQGVVIVPVPPGVLIGASGLVLGFAAHIRGLRRRRLQGEAA